MISIDKRLLAVVLVVVGGLAIFVGRFILDDNELPLPKFPSSQEDQQGSPSNPKASGSSDLYTGSTDSTVPDGPQTRFAGQVIDVTTGLPVPEATVALRNYKGSIPLGHSRTRSGGYFNVEVPEVNQASVTVRAEGYAPARWLWDSESSISGGSNTNNPSEELLLAIAPESVIWVSVEAPPSDLPTDILVESRLLEARTSNEMGATVPVPPVSMSERAQRLGGLIAGRHSVSIRSGSKVLARREIEIGEGEERDLVFRLGPSIRVSGLVLRNEIAVEGGTVQTWCRETQASATIPVDFNGHFEALLPSPGLWRFIWTSSLGNGEGTTLEKNLQTDSEVVLSLNTGRIDGRVVGPRGESVVGLQGSLFGPRPFSFTTDEDGRFLLDDVPYGTYKWVFLQLPERVFAQSKNFEVSGDQYEEFQFSGATELNVTVLRAESEYIQPELTTVPVYLLDESGSLSPLKRTDQPEQFLWPRNGGVGVVYQRGWTPYFFSTGPSDFPLPIKATLQPAGEVTVTLVGYDGEVLSNHPFEIIPLSAPEIPNSWANRKTGPRGSSRVTLSPGQYEIRSNLDSGPAAKSIFITPKESIRLRLP
ncbi:carboxypeptidase-like regulatory domain-containing protein [Planctomycetota bacterium]|nr:carboxypeptidase-like regulatory domain-containing protein [Planctomycetota bacterium]